MRRGFLDAAAKWLGRWPFRCRVCHGRFYRKARTVPVEIVPLELGWYRLARAYGLVPALK